MNFLPNTEKDFIKNSTGSRVDKRNLINDWQEGMKRLNKAHKFIWNAKDFRKTDFKAYDHILGKFLQNFYFFYF